MIEADAISVRRRGRLVLRQVSLTLAPGELLAVMGPNGAGKSTLVDALAGTLALDAGTVALDRRPLSAWEPQALACRRAVLPQVSRVSAALRAWQVVALGRLPHRDRGGAAAGAAAERAAVMAALVKADAWGLAGRWYETLSGGEQQRVQLARVLCQLDGPAERPRFLLLDEPTASLDPGHQHGLLATARRLAAEGMGGQGGLGVLAVLHDANLVAQHADRVLVLQDGNMAAYGTPAEVLEEALIHRVFGVAVRKMELASGRFALATVPAGG